MGKVQMKRHSEVVTLSDFFSTVNTNNENKLERSRWGGKIKCLGTKFSRVLDTFLELLWKPVEDLDPYTVALK